MSKFNAKKEEVGVVENLAGGKAYKRSAKEELASACMTTFLKDEFYERSDTRIDRILELCKEVGDYNFISKLACYCRNVLHLRSVSHLLISWLVKNHPKRWEGEFWFTDNSLVSKTIVECAKRPDDLAEIVACVGKPNIRQLKVGVKKALEGFSRYELGKYKMKNKKYSLIDLFRLYHPKPRNEQQNQDFKDLLYDRLVAEDTWEMMISAAGSDLEKKKDAWKKLIVEGKIGYMALLRNLRNIEDLFCEQKDRDIYVKVANVIADPERVRKSKQIPFRFWSAREQIESRYFIDAISDALEHSLGNFKPLEGYTLVAVDSSGSMTCSSAHVVAKVLASMIIKKTVSDVITYDTDVVFMEFSKNDSVMSIIQKLYRFYGWGTQTSLVFSTAKKAYDNIVIISDNESWAEGYYGVKPHYDAYRKKFDCNPNVFAIDIMGYGSMDIKGDRVYHFYGWSQAIYDYMALVSEGKSIVDVVMEYERKDEIPKV